MSPPDTANHPQTLSSSQDWAYDLVLGILKNSDTKNTDELESAAEEVLD